MRRSIGKWLFGAALALSPALLSGSAGAAGIEACNNIDISAQAECKVEVEGGCVAQCEEVSFQASCSADLYVQCDGQCSFEADVQCGGSCELACEGKCEVDPGNFDCRASCEGTCGGECDASCAASADQARCKASCKATCSGECDASCKGTPPSATCDAKCQASCSGSCTAKANIGCQVDCQADGFAKCETDLRGGCKVQCEKPDGALFCNGEYVDAGDNLKDCLAYLEGILKIDVEGYATGSADAECRNGQCTAEAEGEAGVSCSASPGGSAPLGLGAVAGAVVGAGLLAARRRRKS